MNAEAAHKEAEQRASDKQGLGKKNRKGEIVSECPHIRRRKEEWIQHLLKNCTKDQYINYLLGNVSIDQFMSRVNETQGGLRYITLDDLKARWGEEMMDADPVYD
jgi:hypothetical protein